MYYTTSDYLRDSYWLIDFILGVAESLRPKVIFGRLKLKLLLYSVNYKKLRRNVFRNLPYGLTIIYLGFLAVLTLALYTERSEGIRVVTLTTSSMNPAIPEPSIIITAPASSYQKGDIVTYKEVSTTTGVEFKRTITHRIIEEKDVDGSKVFITKGDANQVPDPQHVTSNVILGKVVFILPYFGYLMLLIKTVPGFFLLVALPAFLLIRNEIRYVIGESSINISQYL